MHLTLTVPRILRDVNPRSLDSIFLSMIVSIATYHFITIETTQLVIFRCFYCQSRSVRTKKLIKVNDCNEMKNLSKNLYRIRMYNSIYITFLDNWVVLVTSQDCVQRVQYVSVSECIISRIFSCKYDKWAVTTNSTAVWCFEKKNVDFEVNTPFIVSMKLISRWLTKRRNVFRRNNNSFMKRRWVG